MMWRRLLANVPGRAGLLAFVIYVCIMYPAIYALIDVAGGRSSGYSMLSYPVMVSCRPQSASILYGTVRDCLGYPVPEATVMIPGCNRTVTDEQGRFVVEGVSPGLCRLIIQAPGYRPLQVDTSIVAGENQICIGDERGLWPDDFHISFHLYCTRDSEGVTRLYGSAGVVNGTQKEYRVVSLTVFEPNGLILAELLGDPQKVAPTAGAGGSGAGGGPGRGTVVKPGMVMVREIPPREKVCAEGFYVLRVVYAPEEEYQTGRYRSMVLRARSM